MSNALELTKKAYKAWESKDAETLRTLLDKSYIAKMPGHADMSLDEALKMIEECPFECKSANETYIVDGNNIVRIWDMVATEPVEYRCRMAELTVVKDGKIAFNEAFFDTASIPKEAMEAMKEPAKAGKK